MRRIVIMGALALAFALPPATTFGSPVASEVPAEMQSWMDARGLSAEADVSIGDEIARSNCWHVKLFGAIRESNGKRVAWAWSKGIGCSWGGKFRERRMATDKGTPGMSWKDGPSPGEKLQLYPFTNHKRIFTHYETDFQMGYAHWTLRLNINQMVDRRVDRKVKWFGGTA